MIPNFYPADELAMIRAQKRRLKDRERQLREGFLSGQLNPVGYEASVEVKEAHQWVLLRDLLPSAIKNDRRYWEERTVRSVVLRKVGARGVSTNPPAALADPTRGTGPSPKEKGSWLRAVFG